MNGASLLKMAYACGVLSLCTATAQAASPEDLSLKIRTGESLLDIMVELGSPDASEFGACTKVGAMHSVYAPRSCQVLIYGTPRRHLKVIFEDHREGDSSAFAGDWVVNSWILESPRDFP